MACVHAELFMSELDFVYFHIHIPYSATWNAHYRTSAGCFAVVDLEGAQQARAPLKFNRLCALKKKKKNPMGPAWTPAVRDFGLRTRDVRART